MKRPSYRQAIEWIAENDEPRLISESLISEMISTAIIADLFGISAEKIAKDVVKYKRKHPESFENL